MSVEGRRYRFNPLEQRGLLAGLQPAQLVLVAVAGLLAVAALRSAPDGSGALIAAGVLGAAAAAAFWRVGGATPAQWIPVLTGWAWRQLRGSHVVDAPTAGRTALVARSSGEPARSVSWRASARPPMSPPSALAGVRLFEVPAQHGDEAVGVVRDTSLGTYGAVLRVRGRSFSLLEPEEKARRLSQWGGALAGVARERSPIFRLQWVERSVPGESDALVRHLERSAVVTGSARTSYADLISDAGPVTQDHDALLFVGVRAPRTSSAVRAFGGGAAGACGLLRRELRLLSGQLRGADIVVDGVLSLDELAGRLRAAWQPGRGPASRRSPLARFGQPGGVDPWPMAGGDGWSTYRTDDGWHATYWIAEWPRIEVGPDFLAPLLLAAGTTRTVAVILEPVPTAEAVREVESARTAEMADEQLRERAGFLSTARRRRQAEGVIRREAELADGHAAFRFSGYVTVTAPDSAALDRGCAEVEQAAQQSYLELRRLFGRQSEAFTWTLPLGRGLR